VAIEQANIQNTTGDLETIRITEPTLLTLYFEDDGHVEPGDTLCVTLLSSSGADHQELVIRGFDELD
jgi:hypothetical protein